MPAAHRAHLGWTPSTLIAWGRKVGSPRGFLRRTAPRRAWRLQKCAVQDEAVNVSARLEVRIQLNERCRPEAAGGVGRIHIP